MSISWTHQWYPIQSHSLTTDSMFHLVPDFTVSMPDRMNGDVFSKGYQQKAACQY